MNKLKRIVDIIMSFILIPLMAYQVTGEAAHEWLGISMVSLVIVHQVLNRKWYASLFKGNYMPFRILSIIVNIVGNSFKVILRPSFTPVIKLS